MDITLIHNGTIHCDKLQRLIPGDERVVWKEDVTEGDIDTDVLIISGGPKSVYGHEKLYARQIDMIQKRKKLTIGICLGHELIAHAFGSPLKRLNEKVRGIEKYVLKEGVFPEIPNRTFNAYAGHHWIVEDVRSPLVSIAHGRDGVAMIQHKDLPIFGFQFHPEHLRDQGHGDELFLHIFNTHATET